MAEQNEFGILVPNAEESRLINERLDSLLAERLARGETEQLAIWEVHAEARDFELRTRGIVPACAAGCGGCCNQTFGVTRVEFALMEEALSDLPPKELFQAQKAARRLLSAWNRFIKKGRFRSPRTANEMISLLVGFRRTGEASCPFLSASDSRCLIYASRPTECRLALSTVPCECDKGVPVSSICDFWVTEAAERHELKHYGQSTIWPLPVWIESSNRF